MPGTKVVVGANSDASVAIKKRAGTVLGGTALVNRFVTASSA